MKRNCVLSLSWPRKLMVRCLVLLGLQLQLLPCVPGLEKVHGRRTQALENVHGECLLVCNSGLLAFHANRRGRVLQKVFSTALHLPMLKMSQEVRNCCRFAHNRLQKCKQQSNTSKNFKQSQQIGQALLVPFSLFRAICSKLVFASNPQRR